MPDAKPKPLSVRGADRPYTNPRGQEEPCEICGAMPAFYTLQPVMVLGSMLIVRGIWCSPCKSSVAHGEIRIKGGKVEIIPETPNV